MPEGVRDRLALRLATNTIVQILGSVAGSAIAFFTFVAVTQGLGPAAYGDLIASIAFVLVFSGVVDSGISNVVFREISVHPDRTETIMRKVLPLRLLIACVSSVAMVALGFAIPFNDRTQLAILIGAVGGLAGMLNLALMPVLQSQLRMHWAVTAGLIGRLATLGLTLGALAAGFGFVGAVWANVAGTVVIFLITLAVVWRSFSLRPVIDVRYWGSLIRGSLALGAAIGITIIYFRIDTLLLAVLVPSEEVGLYAAAFKFLELCELVVGAIGMSVFPLLARLAASRDPSLIETAQKTWELLIAAALPLTVLMLAFPAKIIELTAGDDFADSAFVLQLLAPYVLISFGNGLFWRILMAGKDDWLLVAIGGASLVLRVVLVVSLVALIGYRGAAFAAVAAEAASLALGATAVWRRQGFLPNLRYLPWLAVATLAMTATALLVPAPAVAAGAIAGMVYVGVLSAVPGAVRDSLGQLARWRRA